MKKSQNLLFIILCSLIILFTVGCSNPTDEGSEDTISTITFNTGFDDVHVESISSIAGEPISPPEEPTKDGYKFVAWLMDGVEYNFDKMPSENIELIACWNQIFTITFSSIFDDVQVDPISSVAGEPISPPKKPIKEGFQFIAWLNEDGTVFNFDKMPAKNIELTDYWLNLEDPLPCMSIDLYGKDGSEYNLDLVNRDDYVDSKISFSNTAQAYQLDAVEASFKGRGNGSWFGAGGKNGYKIKFDNKQGLLGRAENKHWVIIACANFNDQTMYRNYLAYNMAGEVFSNLEYSTSAEWIDVYINGEYQGVYLLCEHVRVGKGRVDIDSEYGIEDTGYLIEYDAYATGEENIDYFKIDGVKYPFTIKSPDPEDYLEETTKEQYAKQISYIKSYVQDVYNAALNHDFETFSALADVDSFVDMYIIHELFKNVDTGWSSFYMYKKPGGKLFAGPIWDFDATTNLAGMGNRAPQGIYVAKEVLETSDFTASELYIELYKTPEFLELVKIRWQELSKTIELFVNNKMNENVYELYKTAIGKNFVLWQGKTQAQAETDWVNNSRTLKHWLRDRIDWLNYEWKID